MSYDAFSRPLSTMRYFHMMHQRQLRSFTARTSSLSSISDAQSLSRDLLQFCRGLHAHHSIEDASVFPFLASKTDISHLERHHEQLADTLHEMQGFASMLRSLQRMDEWQARREQAVELVTRAEELVVLHETAEEAVLAPDNLRRHFTEDEMRDMPM